jgi:hypothetical protein
MLTQPWKRLSHFVYRETIISKSGNVETINGALVLTVF